MSNKVIEIYNNRIEIPRDHPLYQPIKTYFVTVDQSNTNDMRKRVHRMYEEDFEQGILTLPRGFLFLVEDQLKNYEVIDHSTNELDIYDSSVDISKLLPGITLRSDQVVVTRSIIGLRRGLIQQSTGSGKTEVIAAVIAYYKKVLGYYPDTMVLAPTTRLVTDTVARFRKYNIPAYEYHDVRGDIKGKVVVSHPMALNNDLEDDPSLLSDVKIMVEDECHHGGAITWESLFKYLESVEVSFGVSASIIKSEELPITNIQFLEPGVAKVVGCTGPVISDIPASYYIDQNILAKPVLIRILHDSDDEILDNPQNWHEIRRRLLESPERSKLIILAAGVFSSIGYKTLILVNTKKHARSLMTYAAEELGLADKIACSFGSGVFEYYDEEKGDIVVGDDTIKDKFDEGSINILIGTSHMYEGVDIPNLDAVVLAVVGKNSRRVIQGIGRALRVTKSGRYAYIIDFTDHESSVLSRHSRERLSVCMSVIGIRVEDIYTVQGIREMKQVVAIREFGDSEEEGE